MSDLDSVLFSAQADSNPHLQKLSNHHAEWVRSCHLEFFCCPEKYFQESRVKSQHGSTCTQDTQSRKDAWVSLIFLLYTSNSYLNSKWPACEHSSTLWRLFPFCKCYCGKVWYSKWWNSPSLSSHINCNVRVKPVTQGKNLTYMLNTCNNTDNTIWHEITCSSSILVVVHITVSHTF